MHMHTSLFNTYKICAKECTLIIYLVAANETIITIIIINVYSQKGDVSSERTFFKITY